MGNDQSQSASTGCPIANNIKVSWSKVNCSQCPPQEGQVACSIDRKIYVFGGVQQRENEMVESNRLLAFDIDSKQWTKVDASGDIPPPCSAAAMTAVGGRIYLFGGLSQECGWFDKLHVFDAKTNKWSLLDCEGTKPSPRDKLQSTAVGNCIYYFGGFGPKSSVDFEEDDDDEDYEDDELADQTGADFGWFNDLYVFDTENKKWSQPMQMNLGLPTPRAAFGMCRVDEYIVIFGGRDTESRRNDLHIFNTGTRKWESNLVPKGRLPEPRSFHTVTSIGHRIIVMGGRGIQNEHFADMHIYDLDTREWYQPNVSGDLPTARGQHCALIADDKMVLFGGTASFNADIMMCTEFLTDTYVLNTGDILKGGSTESSPKKVNGEHMTNGAV